MKYTHPVDQIPRRQNIILKILANFGFWISGWDLIGAVTNTPKLLVIAAPHRSGWEVLLGFMTICSLDLDVRWMGKHTIFRWPLGYLARFFGGIAIDRRQAHGVVGNTVQQFNQREKLFVVLMPEGTRSNADRPVADWKQGYYYIAHKAGVPVMPIYLDHANKRVVFGEAISAEAEQEVVTNTLQTFYDQERETSRTLAAT